MRIATLLLLLASLALGACAVGGRPSDFSDALHNCDENHKYDCLVSHTSSQNTEVKLTDENLPQLGLTFSGGGSKASPFAMGVLKQFVDAGWIYRTQYLTSVSGGSYTAFYLYYRAYAALKAYQNQGDPSTPEYLLPDPQWPGLTRYFVDSRNYSSNEKVWPFVSVHSVDFAANPTNIDKDPCTTLTVEPDGQTPPPMWKSLAQYTYQTWVECYQDLLMTHPAVMSDYGKNDAKLAEDFTVLFAQSESAAPAHWFANLIFDWRKPLSPSQYDYLHGIERTFAYLPPPGKSLPVSIDDKAFVWMANCFDFTDLAAVYTASKDDVKASIGGYLPKWVMQATGTNGDVALNLASRHYRLDSDVFEITFDQYGSGRYGYVRGSPSLVGLTVPWAVLASSAFADTAQRSVAVPRGVVNLVLQTFNVRWGFDIANYNSSYQHRVFHSVLPWPFYYADDPDKGKGGPTIHLSDGGQSGDNLGLVSQFRRGVRNIVVVSGEYDFENKAGGVLKLESLCAANYYLMQHGFEMIFESDPRDEGRGPTEPYRLAMHCSWDGDRTTYVHPSGTGENLTPFNWKRRVWVGHVTPLQPYIPRAAWPDKPDSAADAAPPYLDKINVYYIDAAMDRYSWMKAVHSLYPEDGHTNVGTAGNATPCNGVRSFQGQDYACTLLTYFYATETATEGPRHEPWEFPQTSTAFTTYANSINLFRAYRDLGWLYARELPRSSPEMAAALAGPENNDPTEFKALYGQITRKHVPKECARPEPD